MFRVFLCVCAFYVTTVFTKLSECVASNGAKRNNNNKNNKSRLSVQVDDTKIDTDKHKVTSQDGTK